MEITHGKRPSQDRPEPVSAGIPQMNRHFWPNSLATGIASSNLSHAARPELRGFQTFGWPPEIAQAAFYRRLIHSERNWNRYLGIWNDVLPHEHRNDWIACRKGQ